METNSNPSSSWKIFGSRVPPELSKAVRILAIEQETSSQALMIEALKDVLVKYGKKLPKS